MSPSVAGRLRGTLSLWVVLFLVWLATNSSLAIEVAAVGIVVTFLIAFTLAQTIRIWDDLSFTPRKALFFLRYTAEFLREMVRSNLKVMRRTYAPSIEMRPAIVPVGTQLTSRFGRFVLSNTVALTPGTLVLWVDGQTFYLHVLDLDTNDPTDVESNTRAFLGPFDPILARVFG